MNRRGILSVLTVLAMSARPLRATAQAQSGAGKVQRIAWLSIGPVGVTGKVAFLKGLADRGRAPGPDLVFEEHPVDRQNVQAVAKELARRRVDLIVSAGLATRPVYEAVKGRVPVAFVFSGDPVEAGFVKSIRFPGGNVTGVSMLALEFVGKRFEAMRELLPSVKRMAVVANPQHSGAPAEFREASKAANALGVALTLFEVRSDAKLDNALARIAAERFDAVDFFPDSLVNRNAARIAQWSLSERVPTVSGWSLFVEAGNLLSYGCETDDAFRTVADMALRILKGNRPAEMPIEYPKRTELAINLKAARALGVSVPTSILVRAARVIE